jgi:hypothetical protein
MRKDFLAQRAYTEGEMNYAKQQKDVARVLEYAAFRNHLIEE